MRWQRSNPPAGLAACQPAIDACRPIQTETRHQFLRGGTAQGRAGHQVEYDRDPTDADRHRHVHAQRLAKWHRQT